MSKKSFEVNEKSFRSRNDREPGALLPDLGRAAR